MENQLDDVEIINLELNNNIIITIIYMNELYKILNLIQQYKIFVPF
jgi:hypothetical protein